MAQGVRCALLGVVLALVCVPPAAAQRVDRWYDVRVRSAGESLIDYASGQDWTLRWDWQIVSVVRYRGDDFEPAVSNVRYWAACNDTQTLSRPERARRAKGRRGDFVRAGELALDDGSMFAATELAPAARTCGHGHPSVHLEGLTGYGEEAESIIRIGPREFDPASTEIYSELFAEEIAAGTPHEAARGERAHSFAGRTSARVSIKLLSPAAGRKRQKALEAVAEPARR